VKIYNTPTRKKEEFSPIKAGEVGIYTCGITAYDSCHLGHARSAINFDVIVRYLRFKGFDVRYVRNFTDIDDKIINRALKEGRSTEEIAEQYIEEYRRDMLALGNIPPSVEPRATEHIKEMIELIERLVERGYAYERRGSVFFSVRKFERYGWLSGKDIDELEAGARVEVDESKDDPLDFALWKAGKEGEPMWDSPWGKGRPGWHIECSAMSTKYLGQPFDIHGGGKDLVFPHHENEIAQSEAAFGTKFVNYWMHNGFVNIGAEKMSKSLGNITKISTAISKYGADAIRYFVLSSHYRSPLDYTEKNMLDARSALDRFYSVIKRVGAPSPFDKQVSPLSELEKEVFTKLSEVEKDVARHMDDDFNTAAAIGAIFEAVRTINKYIDSDPKRDGDFFKWFSYRLHLLRKSWGDIFGLFSEDPEVYFDRMKLEKGKNEITEIERLVAERNLARSRKDYKTADEIRDKLLRMGVVLKDRKDGVTEWHFK
jgi:cysteinyl-tRNA synthetase